MNQLSTSFCLSTPTPAHSTAQTKASSCRHSGMSYERVYVHNMCKQSIQTQDAVNNQKKSRSNDLSTSLMLFDNKLSFQHIKTHQKWKKVSLMYLSVF